MFGALQLQLLSSAILAEKQTKYTYTNGKIVFQ